MRKVRERMCGRGEIRDDVGERREKRGRPPQVGAKNSGVSILLMVLYTF